MKFVAHAGGAYRGILYANSHAAIMHSYCKGIRHIELDVACTSDGVFVIRHGSSCREPYSSLQFQGLTLADVFDLMRKYVDLHIMFDFHPGLYEMGCPDMIVDFARRFDDSDISARSVVEVYSDVNALALIKSGFANVQYGWMPGHNCDKEAHERLQKMIAFCREYGVRIVSVPGDYLRKHKGAMMELKDAGLIVYSSRWPSYAMLETADELGVDYVTVDYWMPGGALRNYANWLFNFAWRKGRATLRRLGVKDV